MTFSLETLILVSVLVLCIGGLIGAVISRRFIPPQMQKDLEQQLQTSRNELEQYQQDVAQHFADTAKLVSNLTNAYKDVHEHLNKGAITLTNAEISQKILKASDNKLGNDGEETEALEELNFEPPKDWAPKVPGQKGTLSEEFGLDDHREEENIESLTATATHKA